MKKRINGEPVAAAMLITVVTWLALQFGVAIGTEPATAVAGLVLLVAGWVARQRSTPVERAERAIDAAFAQDPTTGSKPRL